MPDLGEAGAGFELTNYGGSEPEGQQSCPGELKISKSFARSVHVKPVGFWVFLEVCWMPKKVSVRRMLQFGLRVL